MLPRARRRSGKPTLVFRSGGKPSAPNEAVEQQPDDASADSVSRLKQFKDRPVVTIGKKSKTATTQVVETGVQEFSKQRPRRVPASGTSLPTRGLPRVHYWLNKQFNRGHKVPKLSKKETAAITVKQALLDAEWEQNLRDYKRERARRTLLVLSDLVPRQRVSFYNSKGSGATTTTQVNTASVLGYFTHAIVTSADYNLAAGNSAKLLGRGDGKTITQLELLELLKKPFEFGEFISHLRPTEYNVRVLASDPIIDENKDLSQEQTEQLICSIEGLCEYLYLDTLNKITDPSALVVMNHSDVSVFSANVEIQESLRQLGSSMETLRRHGFRDLVNHSVVVISNIPQGMTASDYRKYLNLVDSDNEVTTYLEHEFVGQLLGVPHDPVIKLDRNVDIEAWAWETLQAYMNVIIAIFQQDPRFWDTPGGPNVQLEMDEEPMRQILTGFAHQPDVQTVGEEVEL